MRIAYAAHTESCTLLLDADGICRRVVSAGGRASRGAEWERSEHAAARCVGAQYVASLDVTARGGLVQMPRAGLPMLFARMDPQTGRISLVRTGPVVRFETRDTDERDASVVYVDNMVRELPEDDDLRDTQLDPDDAYRGAYASAYDEAHTHPVRRSDVREVLRSYDVEPDWEDDTETTRFEMPQDELERMRPANAVRRPWDKNEMEHSPSQSGALPTPTRRAYDAAARTYDRDELPRPAPLPRVSARAVPPARARETALPPPPTNFRETVRSTGPAPSRPAPSPLRPPARPRPVTPLPPPPVYGRPLPPLTPPRRNPPPPRPQHARWDEPEPSAPVPLRRYR